MIVLLIVICVMAVDQDDIVCGYFNGNSAFLDE